MPEVLVQRQEALVFAFSVPVIFIRNDDNYLPFNKKNDDQELMIGWLALVNHFGMKNVARIITSLCKMRFFNSLDVSV